MKGQKIKQGASLSCIVKMPPRFVDGFFADWSVRAELRNQKKELIDTLQCEFTDATTRYLRIEKINTEQWPLGRAFFDIRLTRNTDNYTIICNTLFIDVIDNITEAV